MRENEADPTSTQIVLPVQELNNYLSCKLCNGYFREATSISECLHTFCKICITNNFDNQPRGNKRCPICLTELKPPKLIYDRTIQAIVDKIFPHFVTSSSSSTNMNNNHHIHKTSALSSSYSNSNPTTTATSTSNNKRARDTDNVVENMNDDEQEEDDNDKDSNLAIIRVAPYPLNKIDITSSFSSSSSSSSSSLTQLPLPPLSKPLLKAVDTVKISKVQKFILKRLPIEISSTVPSSSHIDIFYKNTKLSPHASLQRYIKELNIMNDVSDEADVILLFYKLQNT